MSTYPKPMTWFDSWYVTVADMNTYVRDAMRWALGHSENPFPHAAVRSSKNIALTSGQFSTLTFDTVEVARGDLWSLTSQTFDTETPSASALIAPYPGMMCAGGCVEIETAACNKALRLIVNGTTVVAEQDTSGVGSPAVGRINISAFFHVDTGDFVELEAFHDLGVPLNALAQANYSPKFWGFYVAVD